VDVTLPAEMVAGAIIGVVRLAGVAERIEDMVVIEPVACRGNQGLWPLEPGC
jgi:hypothetical protein